MSTKAKNNNSKKPAPKNGVATQKNAVKRQRRRARTVQQDPLLRDQKVRGTDIRSVSADTSAEKYDATVVPGTVPTTSVVVEVTDRSVQLLAMGIVLKAIKQGLISVVETSGVGAPYYIYLYLIESFVNAMQGTLPTLQQAPKWFWNIIHALNKKNGSCKTGSVSYEWKIKPDTGTPQMTQPLGGSDDTYSIFWGNGYVSGSDLNGFPVIAALPGYTQQLGEQSISTLWNQLKSVENGVLVADPGRADLMELDTSAFCVCYPEIGSSEASPGALRSTIYSERPITAPLFAKFGIYQPPGDSNWRGWNKAGITAGSPCYIGPRIMECDTKDKLYNKTAPNFKFFNFDEFFNQLSIILCLAQESLSAQMGQTVTPCPLTSQQVQILLRQLLLKHFCNEYAQDIRITGANFIDMVPFVVGPNGNSTTDINMMLPTFFAENIRACTRKVSKLRGGNRNIIDLVPILGRIVPAEQPQLGQYLWGEGNPLYAVNPDEVAINIIDASGTLNDTQVFVDFSTDSILTLCSSWNEWINKLTNVLSPLVSVGTEKGIPALNTLLYTNHQIYVPVPTTVNTVVNTTTARRSSKGPMRAGVDISALKKKMAAAPGTGSDYFQRMQDFQTTALLSFNPSLWNYLSKFVLPVTVAQISIEEASLQGWQTFEAEMYSLKRSSAPSGTDTKPTVWNRAMQAAAVDVKAFATFNNNDLIAGLVTLAEQGGGGFFTSIAGMVGEGLGIKGSAQFAKSIGDMTGL